MPDDKCFLCNKPLADFNRSKAFEWAYCKDCFEDLFTFCWECGDLIEKHKSKKLAENYYCKECFEKEEK